jgi:exonuclease VII small subunit
MSIATGNGRQAQPTEFSIHMEALERLRRRLEGGDLDPLEALALCREAEEHYQAIDAILTRAEREIELLQENGS